MIIYDRHLFWSGISPPEDNAPPVVDSNGMKARKATLESFKPVAGRDGKIPQFTGLIHLDQFSQRDSRNSCEPAVGFGFEKLFGVLIRE